jgi:hypothetical protein
LTSFDPNDRVNTKLTCQSASKPASLNNEYYGGRGISGFSDNVLTAFANLDSSLPSANAFNFKLNEAKYQNNQTTDLTVWLRGYLNPQRTSVYEFNLDSNANAKLFISTDKSSLNKVFFPDKFYILLCSI